MGLSPQFVLQGSLYAKVVTQNIGISILHQLIAVDGRAIIHDHLFFRHPIQPPVSGRE
ncbi:hypothetical protein VIBNIAM115_1480077 [Vibrio nigripulchritudo AM115]|nr:hypothetical protein VIBNIAM115_1480077 [Vibrio nigripulchritudo AM115]